MHTPKSVWIVIDKYTIDIFKRKFSDSTFDLVNCPCSVVFIFYFMRSISLSKQPTFGDATTGLSHRSIICLTEPIIDLNATDKSRYFAQPRPIIVKYPVDPKGRNLRSGPILAASIVLRRQNDNKV